MAAPCPDPSAHRDTKLQEQASTAALYVTSPSRQPKTPASTSDILDKDNKLSSRGAAMSLKHARPEDLPSYPTSGGVTTNHSGNAALLAHGNQKPFEHWKPDASSAAGKAALHAKDYKMAPLWQPGESAAGSKAAAAAHKDGPKLNLWTPEASANGNTAAAQAFKKSTAAPTNPQIVSPDVRNKALLAATKSVSRARSGSTPAPVMPKYPDSANSAHNALNAATVANRTPKARTDDVMDDPALEESRIRYLSEKIVPREMWTEHPPVSIEVEEKKHQDALRASAISMAKGMYNLQQKNAADHTSTAGATAASAAAERNAVATPPDIKQQAMQYIHLQEAAHKLAEERLAKMDPDGAARYREHYGYPLRSPRRKLSMRNSTRRRANSESQLSDDSDDEKTSRRIRHQMSQFSKDLDAVDEKKRQSDRAALMAAAEKKVQAQMKGIDEKVYAQTGKVSAAMMEDWEAKARAKAAQNSEKRTENFGKADIGGGKFMDQSEIEAIAAARLKPTLDEISENAEKRRARDEEIRLDMEERKRQEIREKQNAKEVKQLQRYTQNEEKLAAKRDKEQQKAAAKSEKDQQKAAAKAEKDAEKARKAEEKQAAKEDQRRSKDVKQDIAVATAATAGIAGQDVAGDDEKEKAAPHTDEHVTHTVEPVEQDITKEETEARPSIETSDAEDEDNEFAEAAETQSPLVEDIGSPVLERMPTGEVVLRPDIERHVTQIVDSSDSEGEEHVVKKKTPVKKEPLNSTEHEKEKADPTTTESTTESKVDPSSQATHVGTDGPINKPVPEAIDILKANNLPSTTEEKPSSPDARSPRRISKLLTKLRRRSKPAPETRKSETRSPQRQHHGVLTKARRGSSPGKAPRITADDDKKVEETEPKTKATVSPTDPEMAAFSAAEAQNLTAAAQPSPSSFVRHTDVNKSVSDISSLSSDGPDVPAFRGLVGVKKDSLSLREGGRLGESRSPVRDSRFQEEL
ncbi:hypothetical protein K461DRAFT_289234 [Myriangium duriaei CBS 260.36]|uniref:Eisosome protein 1 n=1 Tax=Myriangium duriaei CBS 260.36 TaxID=1168546 RepID=A0A9P4JDI3_9PEZI|nr:hypothetical protein K461DRAFT_289234 [Myriangium duriaei CBS 260.36]